MSIALVIDDNRSTADVLCQMLDVLRIEARPAYGPAQAISAFGIFVPSLVLLDINMPGVDGLEILAYIRREPRLASVPVVVVTSDDQASTRIEAASGGADAYIVKPVTLDVMESTLKKIGVL